MKSIHSLKDIKERLQAGFDNKEDSIQDSEERNGTQLKAYLIENNNVAPLEVGSPKGEWRELEDKKWFVNIDKDYPETFYLDTTRSRVWILYSIIDTNHSDIFCGKGLGWSRKKTRPVLALTKTVVALGQSYKCLLGKKRRRSGFF